MRTITFYSYKGGVGRSLLVANTAKYLSILGKSVVAIDLDLEAPGLHYKFDFGNETTSPKLTAGVVDILHEFLNIGTFPHSLTDYVDDVTPSPDAAPIRIIRAGAAPQGEYWRRLSRINWFDLFYGHQPAGTPFFLELRERISRDLAPDFCLIDARTGLTEMGGVATTLLPDTVVCLALDSAEHLEGLRAVMQGIQKTTLGQRTSVELVAVVSRLFLNKDSASETQELERIRHFLNEPIKNDLPGLSLSTVVPLHSEPFLDLGEKLLVGSKNSPNDLPLLRDYLRLFTQIIPAEEIRPHVGQLIQRATSRLLDDPEGSQSDLEALTTYCADPEAYRALLKLYHVRKAPLEKTLATAALMWQLRTSVSAPDQLIQDVVKSAYSEFRASDLQKKYADFAENIWRSMGMEDPRICVAIANSYVLSDRREKAVHLLSDYIEQTDTPAISAVVRLVELLRGNRPSEAFSIVNRFKSTMDAPAFQAAWARLVVDQSDNSRAQETLQDPSFRSNGVRSEDPATLYRLLKLAGVETSRSLLDEALEAAVVADNLGHVSNLAEVFQEEGRFDELVLRIRGRLPERFIDELTRTMQRRGRPYRFYRQ